jgi:hypothetical protein
VCFVCFVSALYLLVAFRGEFKKTHAEDLLVVRPFITALRSRSRLPSCRSR